MNSDSLASYIDRLTKCPAYRWDGLASQTRALMVYSMQELSTIPIHVNGCSVQSGL